MALSPYPKYKNTNIPWLGLIPEHWEISNIRQTTKERKELNRNGEVKNILSVTRTRGVIPYSEKGNIGNKHSDDITRYKIVRENDLVLNSMNVIIGSVGKSKFTGCLSPVYYVLKAQGCEPDYLNLFFQMVPFQQSLVRIGNGILAHRMRIPMEKLRLEPFLLPSKSEQILIARYLTHINNKIQKYISAKRKLIKLLEEQKQAIIHQAVTGAIDVNTGKPFLKYRSVDSEWIDRIPEDWKINKIKYISKINPSIKAQSIQNNAEVSFVPMENVDEKLGNIDHYSSRKYSEVSKGYTSFNTGDIIFAKITPCMENGNCAVVGDVPYRLAFGSTEFIVIRPDTNVINTEFLHFLLRDKYFRIICESNMKGSAGQKRISSDFIGNYMVALPNKDEQKLIIEYTEKLKAKFDANIVTAKKEISFLTEYRTRLIADIVTGKVDVRKVASTLPDELKEVIEIDSSDEEIIEDELEVDENESN